MEKEAATARTEATQTEPPVRLEHTAVQKEPGLRGSAKDAPGFTADRIGAW